MSEEDKSALELAEEIIKKGYQVAILANDFKLREQAKLQKIEVYGSAALLCAILSKKLMSRQKATSLYYKWCTVDKKWIPNYSGTRKVLEFKKVIETCNRNEKRKFWT